MPPDINSPLTIEPVRRDACLNATWEVSALLDLIVDTLTFDQEDQRDFKLRGLALRAKDLNVILMNAFDNEPVSLTPSFERKVYGFEEAQRLAAKRKEVDHE